MDTTLKAIVVGIVVAAMAVIVVRMFWTAIGTAVPVRHREALPAAVVALKAAAQYCHTATVDLERLNLDAAAVQARAAEQHIRDAATNLHAAFARAGGTARERA